MPDRLQRSVGKTVAEADRLSASFARQLARVLREVEAEVRQLLKGTPSTTAGVRAARALQVRAAITQALQAAGYDALALEATDAALETMVRRVRATRKAAGLEEALTFRVDAAQTIAALKTLHLADLLEEGDAVANQVTRAVTRGILGGAQPMDLIDDVARVVDASSARVATLYDTAVSIVGRQVEAMHAGEDPETPFLYAGPVDGTTRPFCLARVGKVFTRADIDGMENGQIANVFLTGGGWNCRHTWVEISKSSELYDLLGTDERAPEIGAQVSRVRKKAA
jgi:hypothetical protein